MNSNFKLGLYAVAVLGTLVFGSLFVRAWRQADQRATQTVTPAAKASKPAKASKATGAQTNGIAASPVQGSGTGTVAAAAGTNVAVRAGEVANAATNQVTAEPEEAGTVEVPVEQEPVATASAGRVSGKGFANMVVWGLLAVAALIGLGILAAHDVSQYLAAKTTQALFDENAGPMSSVDYEEVEKVYANGDFLEAIRLLREYQKENPKAAHAQIRIAEIYEKDLNNALAAALEYEEVLKLPLEPERRGWTAVHLVNLYNRLNRSEQAVQWLQRIVAEVPNTPAAAKARDRLAAMGLEVEAPEVEETQEEPPSNSDRPPEPPASGLPRGFRPK